MTGERTKIIIIDDEEDLCFLLGSMLSAHGYEVSSFFSLKSGLQGIRELRPEWVILDNNLPDGLGWKHSQEILGISPAISLINISANPDSARSFSDPRVHYLIKPIDASSIVSLIQGR